MWSRWSNLKSPSNWSGPAIYRIGLCNSDKIVPIQRFIGSDTKGLLCIGKTNNFERRRRNFVRGIRNGTGHSEANLLHILEKLPSFRTHYPNREYEYSYFKVNLHRNLDNLEEKFIKAYVRQFSEVPPLNSAIPKRYGDWEI